MINEYLADESRVKTLFLLVDSRHKPTRDDVTMMDWIRATGLPFCVIATKTDKLSKKAAQENLAVIMDTLSLSEEDSIFLFSAKTGEGKEAVLEYIDQQYERSIQV